MAYGLREADLIRLMVRSAPKERVSNHRAALSFETRPSAAPQDEADRVICVFASASPSSPRCRPARAGLNCRKFHNGGYVQIEMERDQK